jgi:transcriptional regulator with XRE-family HTH domain
MDIRKQLAKEVGGRLKSFRKGLGLSQKDLATKLKVPVNYISRYESGRYFPSSSVVKKMKELFGLDDYWLATGIYLKSFVGEDEETPGYKYKKTLEEAGHIRFSGEVLKLVYGPKNIPINAKILQKKFNISPKEADRHIVELLKLGMIVGFGTNSYIANPLYLTSFGVTNLSFLDSIEKLQRIYIEKNKQKISKIEGMLDMADPGAKVFSPPLKEEKKPSGN